MKSFATQWLELSLKSMKSKSVIEVFNNYGALDIPVLDDEGKAVLDMITGNQIRTNIKN